jgi:two-component system sensor histidine kinase RegB
VHIALAAVILDARTTWAIAGLSVACLGALFLREGMNEAMDHATHMQRMSAHMEGMWVAMVVAAGFIVYFVTRVRRALTIREAELSEAKDFSMRRERFASLAALAAGAAHELATPAVVHRRGRQRSWRAAWKPKAAIRTISRTRGSFARRCRAAG